MPVKTVGILSPGDMGQAIAVVLSQYGLRTIASLGDRSEGTRQLAVAANIENLGSLKSLVAEADIVLSVLVPAAATEAAAAVAITIRANAIAPKRVTASTQRIQEAGGRFEDAAIIGPPPRVANRTRIYVSGLQASKFSYKGDTNT